MKKLILFVLSFLPIILPAQTLEEALDYGLPVVVVNTVNGEEPTAERIDAPEGCLGVSITNVTKVPGRVEYIIQAVLRLLFLTAVIMLRMKVACCSNFAEIHQPLIAKSHSR